MKKWTTSITAFRQSENRQKLAGGKLSANGNRLSLNTKFAFGQSIAGKTQTPQSKD